MILIFGENALLRRLTMSLYTKKREIRILLAFSWVPKPMTENRGHFFKFQK